MGELERGMSRRVKVYSLAFEIPSYQTRLISIVPNFLDPKFVWTQIFFDDNFNWPLKFLGAKILLNKLAALLYFG